MLKIINLYSREKNKVLLYHISFWLSYVIFGMILKASRDPEYISNIKTNLILDIFLINLPTIFAFYASWYTYSKYLQSINLIRLTLFLIITFIFYNILWYIIDYWIAPAINIIYAPSEFKLIEFLASILYIFIQWSLIAFGFQYFKKTLKHEKQLRLLQNEKLEIDYAYLRAQINPHFLNNTLNFFYAKSLPLSSKLSNGIMTLSEIMRYSLQVNQNNQLMPLIDEIDHIRNIISINQFQTDNSLHLDLRIIGDIQNILIVPLTLVILLENILKHGNCNNQDERAIMKIIILEKDNNIKIETFNKKKSELNEQSNGNSLENLQNRLKSYYGENFYFKINDQNEFYELSLNMPIQSIKK